MSNSYYFPFCNPIRLHNVVSSDFFYNQIPSFEAQIGYNQPYVMGDRPYLQVMATTSGATMTMRLVDLYGVIYKTWPVYYSGYQYGTGSARRFVYHWINTFPYSSQISEGVYFLQLTIEDSDGTLTFYSEPIMLTILAPDNTVTLVYSHDVNDFDTVFVSDKVIGEFLMRIEGGMKSDGFTPGGKFTMFQDQDYRSVVLNSQPYNVEKFTFGPSIGAPNYIGDKINRIFALLTVTIDGVGYSRNEGAKVERSGDSGSPIAGWVIDLVKTENPYSEGSEGYNILVPLTCDSTLITCDNSVITADQTQY